MIKKVIAAGVMLAAFGALPASRPPPAEAAPLPKLSVADGTSDVIEVRRRGGKNFRRGFRGGKHFRHRGFKRHRFHRHRGFKRHRFHRHRFHRHRFHRHRGWGYYGYRRRSCNWLRVQAIITGSGYWWRRYYRCRHWW